MSSFSEENAMCLVATMAAGELAGESGMGETEALELLLSSRVGELLFHPDLKLWWDGPSAIADALTQEARGGGTA